MSPYTPPQYLRSAFTCPHCGAFTKQSWRKLYFEYAKGGYTPQNDLMRADCDHCFKYSIWFQQRMMYPTFGTVPPPNKGLSDKVLRDYEEARSIVDQSPKAAAALLRLGLQKLMIQLGEKGRNLNDDVANLVKVGLPVQIQQSLQNARVIGGNAVYPGVVDLRDDRPIAMKLFELVNFIAQSMIPPSASV